MFKNIFKKETTYVSVNLDSNGKTTANRPQLMDMNKVIDTEQFKKPQQTIKQQFTELTKEKGPFKVKVRGDSILEEALNFFEEVYGLPDVKENLYRALISDDQVNPLLIGPPATSKTLFMDIMSKKCNNTIYFDASNTSGAGLIEALSENRTAKNLLIDEIDKLNRRDMNCLLGLLNNGHVIKTLKNDRYNFQMDVKVFATSNSLDDLSKPIRSRFQEYHLPEYSDEDFVEVVKFCLRNKFPVETSEAIAQILLINERKDVRAALGVSALIKIDRDTIDDMERIIKNWLNCMSKKDEEDLDYN